MNNKGTVFIEGLFKMPGLFGFLRFLCGSVSSTRPEHAEGRASAVQSPSSALRQNLKTQFNKGRNKKNLFLPSGSLFQSNQPSSKIGGGETSKCYGERRQVSMPRLFRPALACTMILAVAFSSFVQAQTAPNETQKIELLIEQVAQLRATQFVRNGSAYSAETAATFLRRKWQANNSAVKTARDFIDKVASFSGTSGKPYLLRMQDGTEVRSRDFLRAALNKLEKTMPENRTSGG